MRTSSPQGSMRSQGGRGRPRGRDVFDEGVQTGPAGLLAPPPVDSRGMSVERNEREDTPRRKRPGYFSAREEDLDPLDMDVEDFITPAKKKQRLSVQSGPKFAALWEPSKRENWPLGDDSEKMEEDKNKSGRDSGTEGAEGITGFGKSGVQTSSECEKGKGVDHGNGAI